MVEMGFTEVRRVELGTVAVGDGAEVDDAEDEVAGLDARDELVADWAVVG